MPIRHCSTRQKLLFHKGAGPLHHPHPALVLPVTQVHHRLGRCLQGGTSSIPNVEIVLLNLYKRDSSTRFSTSRFFSLFEPPGPLTKEFKYFRFFYWLCYSKFKFEHSDSPRSNTPGSQDKM